MDNSTVIVERNNLDANKAVVVLRSSEDKRQVNMNNKRTFTVLIRAPTNPDVKLAHYYMIFAYIR
jgi:type II secretory pathway component HofQ